MHDPVSNLAREEFRYPDALPLMPLEPARATVDTAERIYVFTLARLEQIAP